MDKLTSRCADQFVSQMMFLTFVMPIKIQFLGCGFTNFQWRKTSVSGLQHHECNQSCTTFNVTSGHQLFIQLIERKHMNIAEHCHQHTCRSPIVLFFNWFQLDLHRPKSKTELRAE